MHKSGSYHLTFNVAVTAFMVALIAETIANVIYFQSLYNNGGTPFIGKTSSGVMFAFNIVALVLEFIFMVWAVMRIFAEHSGGKSILPYIKSGMKTPLSELVM